MENLFTPATLATRWECSEKHVRNLIKSGKLKAFQLGEKLFRIRQSEVEAFESRSMEVPPPTPEAEKKPVERLDPLKRAHINSLRRNKS